MPVKYGKRQEIAFSAFHKRYLPVFFCKPDWNKSKTKIIGWKFLCPYCRKLHYHSAVPGPREAHCKSNSPLYRVGYWLEYFLQEPST